ncbi:serine-rich adhesin for platelets isoform X3 [Rhizophagus clarus]|uniref:Serine-rich adhesin for platelets isoform X3 n=1 Tax=Rhizophagus clarus TaxID=94130 RepID=A0A8H3MAV0_9GLOM|nr:serine-rich adhesin for platelets isoform X3 [Rhizophagus clarus]
MASQRGRRTTRRAAHDPDFEYGIGPSSSEQEINGSSQNTVVKKTSSEENETDQSTRAIWLRKWKRSDPGLCCVCLDEDATKDNVLVYCDGKECDVVVHQECYGITTLPKKEDPWYCDRCLALPSDAVRCVLCPNKNGAFRKIRASDEAGEPMVWVHILCAFWMPGMHIGSAADLRDIQVVNVDPKNWGKKCHVCNSEEGAAIHCDAGQCKNWVHATCAVAYGLTEYVDEENISDPYFIYCKQHGPNDHPRQNKIEKWIRMRDDFLAEECLKRSDERNAQFQGGFPGQNLREIFEDAYAGYTAQREVRITDARRQIVQQASKHNGLIDAKEKAEKNVRDFRAKIPNVKVENTALKNYLEKVNEAILSLVPHMRNIQAEIHGEGSNYMKVETLMESVAIKNNIVWSKEIRGIAKSINVKQLNTNEMRSLNLKSVVSALAKAAREEKEKARQRGRRNGLKGRGRPKTPNKGKEKIVVNQEEVPEGEDYDGQQTPKRTTRSRAASIKGKEKTVEDEGDSQKSDLSNENTIGSQQQLRKVPRLRIISLESQQMTENTIESETPKRKHAELPSQDQLPDITDEVQTCSSKRKRVQENLSATSTNTTEAESISSKKNAKRSKRKRVEDVLSESTSNVDEQTQAEISNNNDQASTSMPADEVAQSAPAKRQYKKSRKSANKGKKADEKTPASSDTSKIEASETIQGDSPSPPSKKAKRSTKKVKKVTKSNEPAGDVSKTNDANIASSSKKSSKRTSTKNKTKNSGESKVQTKAKLRPIAPKTSEITNVLNVEEKNEGSTFPVVLSKPKNDVTNITENNDTEDGEQTSKDITTTILTHSDISDGKGGTFDQSSQGNVNKAENNEESSSNTRSGGVIGISTLLNPIEDTPSSTSTAYDSYLYTVNASTTNQSYFNNNGNLYQASSTSNSNLPITSIGTPLSESGASTFQGSYNAVSQGTSRYSYSYATLNATTCARSFGSVSQGGTSTFTANTYTPINQNNPTMFTNSYSNVNETSRTSTKFTNLTNTGLVSSINAPNLSGLGVLLSAAEMVESPKTTSFIVQKNNEIQNESKSEPSQNKSQTLDKPAVTTFYGGASTNDGKVCTNATNTTEGAVSPYRVNVLSFPGPNPLSNANTTAVQDDNAVAETSSELSKENDTQNVEANTQDEGTNDEPVQDAANSEELVPEQNTATKPKRKRVGGIKKKAGRKPKAKLTEEEAAQCRAPIPQPTCTICRLVIPPANDQPSATYITPQRARESMLLKGRDKVNRMVRCGYCSKWYHLACMVPPRRTMPTGGYVWRCAECDHPSSSTSESPAEHSGSGEAPSVPTIPTKKWNLRSATR